MLQHPEEVPEPCLPSSVSSFAWVIGSAERQGKDTSRKRVPEHPHHRLPHTPLVDGGRRVYLAVV